MSTFIPLNIAVLTVSDTRTFETDKSGAFLVERLESSNHVKYDYDICPDDLYKIRAKVSTWIADSKVDVIILTGGTGVTGRDVSVEAIKVLCDKEIEGFGELFRYISFSEIGASTVQSRTFSGVANATYIFCLPGSTGACKTAWDKILQSQLDNRTKPCNFSEMKPRLSEK